MSLLLVVETGAFLCLLVMFRASALAMILGKNAKKYACFENEIKMWVYEEMIGDRKLSEIINTEHENVKYPFSEVLFLFPSSNVSSWFQAP